MSFAFRTLDLYQDVKIFVVNLYRLSSRYPRDELFGLRSQLTRAATSVLLNFAEGMMCPIVAIADPSLDLGLFTPSQHRLVLIKSEEIIKRLYGLKRKS